MTVKIGINGFGRIGRNYFRAALAKGSDLEIVAVNDLTDNKTLAHLLKYDSITGRLDADASSFDGDTIIVNGKTIKVLRGARPGQPAVGRPRRRHRHRVDRPLHQGRGCAQAHRRPAPRRSSSRLRPPATTSHVRHGRERGARYDPATHDIISNASCTTNCLAPLAKVFMDEFGIERGLMTTVHAYTADQNLQDGPHSDLRRARAAAINIVPTSTGAAKAHRPRAARARRQARRLRAARAGAHRLDHRPHRHRHQVRSRSTRSTPRTRTPPRARSRASSSTPRTRSSRSDIVGDPHSSIFDAGLTKRDRQPGQGRRPGTTTSGATPTASSTSPSTSPSACRRSPWRCAPSSRSGPLAGKRVIVRCDLNVPLKDGHDHRRRPRPGVAAHAQRRCSMPGATVVVDLAPRPAGRRTRRRSTASRRSPQRLGELLGQPVALRRRHRRRVRARTPSTALERRRRRRAREPALQRRRDVEGRRPSASAFAERARRARRRRSSPTASASCTASRRASTSSPSCCRARPACSSRPSSTCSNGSPTRPEKPYTVVLGGSKVSRQARRHRRTCCPRSTRC